MPPIKTVNTQLCPQYNIGVKTASVDTNGSTRKNFEVIDTIRFIAMGSIVWGHCNLGCETAAFTTTSGILLQSVILQLGKIGTIIFFLISGFLIGPKIKDYTPVSFLKLRLRSTIIPWLAFVAIFILLNLFNNIPLKIAINQKDIPQVFLINLGIIKNSIFYFAYWFIIVFVISAVLLIALKQHLNNKLTGIILGLITMFYSINLHYGWVSVHHTKAFLGYAFFMWLGIQISRRHQKFITLLTKTPWWIFTGMFVVSFAFSCYEGVILSNKGCADPYASIRFTNIINSLIAFACLFKRGQVKWISRLEPRHTVYGVYLLHSVLIYEMITFYGAYFSSIALTHNIGRLLFAEIVTFALILSLSILLVNTFKGKYQPLFAQCLSGINNQVNRFAAQVYLTIGTQFITGQQYMYKAYKLVRFTIIIMVPTMYLYVMFRLRA